MRKTAVVLIDYENIDTKLKEDLGALEQAAFRAVTANTSFDEITLRFYGGWYDKSNPSMSATTLSGWIHTFPHSIKKTVINAEFARSLAFEKTDLTYTFRTRSKYMRPRIDPSKICHGVPECHLLQLSTMLSPRRCSHDKCKVRLQDAFVVDEQKLVDTMLAVDLIHYSEQSIHAVYLVSSDDDLVPAVRYTCFKGSQVTIIHTKPHAYRYRPDYTRDIDSLITQGWL